MPYLTHVNQCEIDDLLSVSDPADLGPAPVHTVKCVLTGNDLETATWVEYTSERGNDEQLVDGRPPVHASNDPCTLRMHFVLGDKRRLVFDDQVRVTTDKDGADRVAEYYLNGIPLSLALSAHETAKLFESQDVPRHKLLHVVEAESKAVDTYLTQKRDIELLDPREFGLD